MTVTGSSCTGMSKEIAAVWPTTGSACCMSIARASWVGTDNGLDRFDSVSQTFTHYVQPDTNKRGNGSRHVHAILEDGARGFWIATSDGLQHFDPVTGTFRSWHHDEKDP